MPNAPYLIRGLGDSALSFQHIVTAVMPEKYDLAVDPERFSFREAVAHVADWEPILRERIRICAEEPGGVVPAFDETQRGIEQGYASADPVECAARLVVERGKTVEYLKGLRDEQWAGIGVHPERGEMSAYDWANTILGHDLYHIEHLLRYLVS